MAHGNGVSNTGRLASEVKDLKLEEDDIGSKMNNGIKKEPGTGQDEELQRIKRASETPTGQSSTTQSPQPKSEREETVGGDISVKVEPGKAPKLSRTMSQKVIAKPRTLFSHLPDATADATSVFDVLSDCHYAAKYLGSTEQALECDCTEEWDSVSKSNHACGENSDCINRATKMECPEDCGCGAGCDNQRFQRKQYADVSVIKTDKKGYGLRTNAELQPNDFIFEYIGEVISEPAFRRRMHQYDQEGIKHFYFMSLNKGEFVDATKKGNLGRFCNHSCNPNCYVDKWVVGDKLRMGIFAERHIEAGEELVFNYNVDRYGADPQPCYCGEPNCSGYIGGKTQTGERATQLSSSIQAALGILNFEDWDEAVTKKPRKKKSSEDDEEYVDSVELRPLGLSECVTVMSELYKTQEKWIVVKLLDRVQKAEDERVHMRVAKTHGYRIINKVLNTYMEDVNIVLQVLDILDKIPRLTRNKIVDSKIDVTVEKLVDSPDERVKTQAAQLLDEWSKLEVAYRIPRVKRDPNTVLPEKKIDRPERRDRDRSRSRSRSKSVDVPKGPSAPTGPRNQAVRGPFFGGPRPPFRPRPQSTALPQGWFEAVAQNGSTYYYNATGTTTWQRPTGPAMAAPPPPPPKVLSDQQVLQNLINSIVSNKKEPEKSSAAATPTQTPPKENKDEKWRSYPIEKQKKYYENALFPTVSYVMGKYKGKIDKDDLKRFGKEVAKKLVESDFKNNRVKNPTKLDSKQEKAVKKYVISYFEKVYAKKKEHDKRKAGKETATTTTEGTTPIGSPSQAMDIDDNGNVSDADPDDDQAGIAPSPATLKRRHEEPEAVGGADDETSKRLRTDELADVAPPPPPPPPPPPAGEPSEDTSGVLETQGKGKSPFQIATPPTTGSPDDNGRIAKEFSGMNPERLRSLGLMGEQGNR